MSKLGMTDNSNNPHRVIAWPGKAALLLLLLSGGCVVGPDYQSPLTDVPGQTGFLNANAPQFSAATPNEQWWRLYDEPVLNTVVEEALAANTDLRVAAANLQRAEAVVLESRRGRLPSAEVSTSVTRGRQNTAAQFPASTPEDEVYSANVNASYQLDLFGRVSRAIEASRSDADAREAAYHVTQITVAAETARAFTDACSSRYQLDVVNNRVALLNRSYELTSQLLEAGQGTALDVAGAASLLEQTRALIPVFEARQRESLYRLAVLMGRPPAEYPVAAEQCTALPVLSETIPVGDGLSLLQRRPDIRQAERELAAATARVGIVAAELYPDISIGASASSVALAASELGERDVSSWSVGPLLSWRFPNLTAVSARKTQAEASVEAALARFDGVWLHALEETETALISYSNELRRMQALQSASMHSADAARLANARFEAGQLSFLDVLQTELTLSNVQLSLAESEARISELQIALFLSLGGGWGDR